MRRLLGLLILPAILSARNQLVIYNTSGSANTRPVVIGRPFAPGEIIHYPRPVINGTPAATWQAHVIGRWNDGYQEIPVSAVTYGNPVVLHFDQPLTIMNGAIIKVVGVPNVDGTYRALVPTAFRIALIGKSATGTYSGGGKIIVTEAQATGSVRYAMIAFNVSIPAGGSVTVTFQDSTSSCGPEPCDTITVSELQSFSWQAKMHFTQGNTVDIDARTMLSNGHYTELYNGPVVAIYRLADRDLTRTYDFGWTCTSNCSGNYSTATWQQ